MIKMVRAGAMAAGWRSGFAHLSMNVHPRDGKLHPASVGDLRLDLQPGDVSRFEIRSGPILGAAGTDFFTVGCRTRMPATVTLHCDGRSWTSPPGVIHLLRADGLAEGREYEYNFLVFEADARKCKMQAWTCGGLKTPDNERKPELVDERSWEPRKQSAGGQ